MANDEITVSVDEGKTINLPYDELRDYIDEQWRLARDAWINDTVHVNRA